MLAAQATDFVDHARLNRTAARAVNAQDDAGDMLLLLVGQVRAAMMFSALLSPFGWMTPCRSIIAIIAARGYRVLAELRPRASRIRNRKSRMVK